MLAASGTPRAANSATHSGTSTTSTRRSILTILAHPRCPPQSRTSESAQFSVTTPIWPIAVPYGLHMRFDPLRLACTVSRRSVITGAVAAASAALAGCRSVPAAGELWHHGRLYVATGNTTGTFYQIGGGYADIITRFVTGYQATAEPS